MDVAYAPGSLVTARGREWVVLPDSDPDLLVLRPLGGSDDEIAAVFPDLEPVDQARFPAPSPDDLGDARAAGLLRTALRIGFRSSAGPFRSLASIAVEPRPYQLVPLLMAMRQPTVRMAICDDVGIGKTVESGLIAVRAAGPGRGQRAGGAVLAGAGRAVAGGTAHQVRHRRRARARLHGAAPGARARLRRVPLRQAPDRGGLHRLHQVAAAPRRLRHSTAPTW